jgi:transposase
MTKTSREIKLTQEERRELTAFTGSGMRSVKLLKRAEIILALDTSEGRNPTKEADIAEHIGVSRQTIQNVKKDFFASRDPGAFLQRKKRETPPVPAKITGEVEARIIALACSQPPAGYSTWTLRLLADTCVELQYVDSLSHMTVSRLLKKLRLNPT